MVKVMKVCLLTTKYPLSNDSAWLTNELARSLNNAGHDVTVLALSWLMDDPPSSISNNNGVNEIRVKLPNIFYKKNKLSTLLKLLFFPVFAIYYASLYIKKCDLLVANTPCVTIIGVPIFFKIRFKSKLFLVVWDFFPYYLKDLKMVRSKASFHVLHFIEKMMFRLFDKVGCMTDKNISFLMEKYEYPSSKKIIKLPIWTKVMPAEIGDSDLMSSKYNLPKDKLWAVYGGAMSAVQGLNNLLALAEVTQHVPVHYILVGDGAEKKELIDHACKLNLKNITFLSAVSRDDYNKLIVCCHIGLIFLSENLTVPSFPSKSLDYFRASLPIIAGIDSFTDFKEILQNEIAAGFAEVANRKDLLSLALKKLVDDPLLREKLGKNGRMYYERTFDVAFARASILKSVTG